MRQLELGAVGITVAKLSEAIEMATHGIDDIFIANQVTQAVKMKGLCELHENINLIVGADHPEQIEILAKALNGSSKKLPIRIEIDCGFGRCGLHPEDPKLIELAQNISRSTCLKLDGLFTHAGQAYLAKSYNHVKQIAGHEASAILYAKKQLEKSGIEIANTSVGSTPTAREVIQKPGISEARPGNYIFYDGIQQALGVCSSSQCSLFVLATVTAQPDTKRVICDAGSKALNLDKGAHSAMLLDHFGQLTGLKGRVTRVSEEHGIIDLENNQTVKIGSPLLIIPNHACVVANLYKEYNLITENKTVQTLPISARGMSQ